MGLVPSAAFAEVSDRAAEAAQQQQPGIEATVDGQQQETANNENTDANKGTGNENSSSTSENEKAEGTASNEKAADSNSAESKNQSEATQQPAEQAADVAAGNAIAIATYSDGGTLSYHNGELTKKMLRSFLVDNYGDSTSMFRIKQASESDWHTVDGTWMIWPQADTTLTDYGNGVYSVQIRKQTGTNKWGIPVYDYVDCGSFALQKQFNISNITIAGCETGALQVNGTDIAAPYAVNEGADFNFTVKPVEDFKVDTVTVNGNPILPNESGVYTITNMSSDKSIVATYKADNEAGLTANFSNATVAANGTTLESGKEASVAANQNTQITVTPNTEGNYAVTSIKLGDEELIQNATFDSKTHAATVSLDPLAKDTHNTLTIETKQSQLKTTSDFPEVGVKNRDRSNFKNIVFRDAVDTEGTVPEDLSVDKVEIEYLAGTAPIVGEIWVDVTKDPTIYHAFGENPTETVRIKYAGAETNQYPGWEKTFQVEPVDSTIATTISMNPSCTLLYADEETMQSNLFELLQPSVKGNDGKLVKVDKSDFTFNFKREVSDTPQTVTVTFKGKGDYASCSKTAQVTVVKGKSTLTVSSKSIDYGTEIGINDLVSTTPSNAETKPITVIAGIDSTASGFISLNLGGNEAIQSAITTALGGDEFSVSQLNSNLQMISDLLKRFGVSDPSGVVDALQAITSMLSSVPGMGNATIRIGKTPSNAGVYLVGAATTSSNYKTSVGMGYLTIARSETKAALEFHHKIGTNVHLKVTDLENMDYSVDATIDKAPAGNKVDLLVTFAGTTDEGKAYLKMATVKGDNQDKLKGIAPTNPGLYAQTVFCIGNYPASPISRIYTINKVKTTLAMDDVTATYDGSAKHAAAKVYDEDGQEIKGANITFTYTDADGTVTAEAPSEAGTYTVNAAYEDPNGKYAESTATATLTINPVKATLGLANTEQTYDGNSKEVEVTGAENLPEIGVSVTYNGSTNLPIEAGTYAVKAVFDPENKNYDVTSAEGTLVIKPAEASIALSGTGSFTYDGDAKATIATLPEGIPGKVNLSYSGTLHDGTAYGPTSDAPTEAGNYTVTAAYEGSPNYHIADVTGSINIDQAKTKVEVKVPTDVVYEHGKQWKATATAYVDGENGKAIETVPVTYTDDQGGQTYGPTKDAPSFAGGYLAYAKYEGSNNYEPSSISSEGFRIHQQPAYVQIPAYVIFEGEDEPQFTATVGNYGSNGTFIPYDNQDWWIKELGLSVDSLDKSALLNGQENVYDLNIIYTNENYDVNRFNPVTNEVEGASCTILPALTVTADEHGAAAAFEKTGEPAKGGAAGTELNLTATAEDGYEFAGWVVESGDATIADAKAANTTLTMGEKSSTVKATFAKKEQPTPPADPSSPSDPSTPAADNNGNIKQASDNAKANKEQTKSAVQTGDNSLAPIALGFAGTAAAVALAALIMMMRRRRS